MDRPHHHHMAAVRELDLTACHPHSIADRISAVPGLRTSAAFLTFLRANLVIPPSALSSHATTPVMEPASPSAFSHPMMPSSTAFKNNLARSNRPPSSPLSSPPLVPLDDIPDLSLETLSSDAEKVEGLHLVADSVAQMRFKAARSVVAHPLCLAGLAASLSLVYRFYSHDASRLLIIATGVIMSYLMGIRYFTNGYVDLAERVDWSWLRDPASPDGDLVLGARYDDTLVGALVLQLNPAVVAGRKKSRQTLRGGTGVIRAWTTNLKHRGQGIGKDLLAEAVRITKEKCGKDAAVGFAKEHANSTMLLPSIFNGTFKRDEIKATKALDAVISDWEATRRKR